VTRRARFKVNERCDGAPSCTVVVEVGPAPEDAPAALRYITRALISVRPKGRRRLYTLPLATVAEMIVARVVKAEIPERIAKKHGWGRRG
jgi:hypothetical protein